MDEEVKRKSASLNRENMENRARSMLTGARMKPENAIIEDRAKARSKMVPNDSPEYKRKYGDLTRQHRADAENGNRLRSEGKADRQTPAEAFTGDPLGVFSRVAIPSKGDDRERFEAGNKTGTTYDDVERGKAALENRAKAMLSKAGEDPRKKK